MSVRRFFLRYEVTESVIKVIAFSTVSIKTFHLSEIRHIKKSTLKEAIKKTNKIDLFLRDTRIIIQGLNPPYAFILTPKTNATTWILAVNDYLSAERLAHIAEQISDSSSQ
jgi:hypothetical protein